MKVYEYIVKTPSGKILMEEGEKNMKFALLVRQGLSDVWHVYSFHKTEQEARNIVAERELGERELSWSQKEQLELNPTCVFKEKWKHKSVTRIYGSVKKL